ncbi:unnamed protein product [Victoria cruziana]
MQEIFGSIRRSLVFPASSTAADDDGSLMKGIRNCVRRSRIGLLQRSPPQLPPPRPLPEDAAPPIRWRKGETIGCGAYGRVYMGMNLDSGELLAVKQVLIAANNVSKEKAQAHIRELEEEVKLLKNLSHKNIVRYLGTAREDEALNILMEFVPGGSISSLLGKFGSFPEPVIRMYTKQLLQGLEYLHRKGVIHRDIKGANILVDNKGCIKLADFGASKQVVELATISAAKSMKGTPYWMAPEVILQTGHGFSADIWSVGCTVIEMATGKPPWSEKYQEASALFHIGTTKSHPPIPEHLSLEAQDFLLKCLQKEPNLRPSASDLLQHPFVVGECQDVHPFARSSVMEQSMNFLRQSGSFLRNSFSLMNRSSIGSIQDVPNLGSVRCSTVYPERKSRMSSIWQTRTSGDLCRLGDEDEDASVRLDSVSADHLARSFNPMSEPVDDWQDDVSKSTKGTPSRPGVATDIGNEVDNFSFPCGQLAYEDDEEVTESKIRAFLDEKALELKKLQTPLYEEFYNTMNTVSPATDGAGNEISASTWSLPPKSRSPSKVTRRESVVMADSTRGAASPGSCSRLTSTSGHCHSSTPLWEVPPSRLNEGISITQAGQQEPAIPSCSEQQRLWKEELVRELETERERKKRSAANNRKISSPRDIFVNRQKDQSGTLASP